MANDRPNQIPRFYVAELWADLRRIRPANVRRAIRFLGVRWRVLCIAGVLFVSFHQLYFWTGRHFENSFPALLIDNGLYGFDVLRVANAMLIPRYNPRSNVHPFFVLYAKPITSFHLKTLGLGKIPSAIAVSAEMAALAVVLALIYLRVWGVGLPESAVFAAIYGASTTVYLCGAAPETAVFSNLSIALLLLLACLAIRRGVHSSLLWILSGIFTYGTTISNVVKNLMAFALSVWGSVGVGHWLSRVASYTLIVIGASLLLTRAADSSFNLSVETWITTPETRGGTIEGIASHLVRNFLVYDFVGPTPTVRRVKFHAMDNDIASFNDATYEAGPRLLAAVWEAILIASIAIALARRRRDEMKMIAVLTLCLAMDFALFSRYYLAFEGVFLFSPHLVFTVFALTAFLAGWISAQRPVVRVPALVLMALFLAGQVANNVGVMLESARLLKY